LLDYRTYVSIDPMNNPLRRFTDELFELGQNVGRTFVRDVVKGIPNAAKTQVSNSAGTTDSSSNSGEEKVEQKPKPVNQTNSQKPTIDPTTGKPPPSPKMLTELKNKVDQLEKVELEKVRQELAKQRDRIPDEKLPQQQGVGPELKVEEKKPDDAVTKLLNASRETGEYKGSAGGG